MVLPGVHIGRGEQKVTLKAFQKYKLREKNSQGCFKNTKENILNVILILLILEILIHSVEVIIDSLPYLK